MSESSSSPQPSDWPLADLEAVDACPVCAGLSSVPLYSDLTDQVFNCAPGLWQLVSCNTCSCAYVNPRPTPGSIGKAYATYFTHEPLLQGIPSVGTVAWWRRATANAYRNDAFGTTLRPSLGALGVSITKRIPARKLAIESEAAGLLGARPSSVGQSLLLDIGCGNGLALARARAAGWRPLGVEPDPVAAEAARACGIEVLAPAVSQVDSAWDCRIERITLSHVIEHVHDPVLLLNHCRRLLKPGGTLWIETPNLDAVGHDFFGAHWQGLDPPRHLILFRERPLLELLDRVGFERVAIRDRRRVELSTFLSSVRMEAGLPCMLDDYQGLSVEQRRRLTALLDEARAVLKTNPTKSEFLTVEATA